MLKMFFACLNSMKSVKKMQDSLFHFVPLRGGQADLQNSLDYARCAVSSILALKLGHPLVNYH